jgi:hypothetical protein
MSLHPCSAPTAACHLPRLRDCDSTTREDLDGGARGPGPARVGLLGLQCSARARCSGQLRSQKNDTRIASLDLSTAKHLKLLAPATLKSVIELCSLIASRPFSAPPTCNLQPDDRQLRFFFRRCSYSTILRGWPCQPRIPAGRPPCPTAPFSTYSYLLLAHHHPTRPPRTG